MGVDIWADERRVSRDICDGVSDIVKGFGINISPLPADGERGGASSGSRRPGE